MRAIDKARKRKIAKETEGMTPEEKENYLLILEYQEKFQEMVDRLEAKLFPEIYNFMLDEWFERQMRRRGENPMGEAYTKEVNERRARLGFEPLGADGLPHDDTWDYCRDLILKKARYQPQKSPSP